MEVVMTYFKALFWNLPGGTEENQVQPWFKQQVSRLRHDPKNYRYKSGSIWCLTKL